MKAGNPSCSPPTVVLVAALYDEVEGLLSALGSDLVVTYENPERSQKIWTTNVYDISLHIALSGVLEHNAVGLTSRLLAKLPKVDIVINFGCVGATCGMSMAIRDWAFVKEARHYDIGDNVLPKFYAPMKLSLPKTFAKPFKSVVCTTGARFTKGQEGCDCEDMEIYGLAILCDLHDIPLVAIKYAANFCNDHGIEDFKKNVVDARQGGQDALVEFLKEFGQNSKGLLEIAGSG